MLPFFPADYAFPLPLSPEKKGSIAQGLSGTYEINVNELIYWKDGTSRLDGISTGHVCIGENAFFYAALDCIEEIRT